MTKTIEFKAMSKYVYDVAPRPFPASQAIPQWWKDGTPYFPSIDNFDGKKIIIQQLESNATFKKCKPMLDTISAGYIIPLWADVQVRIQDGKQDINWRVRQPVFELHGGDGVEIPEGYSKQVYKFLNGWIPQLPKGYSLLVVSPIGYPNSPFRAINGMVDYDKSQHPLYPPVFLKEGFEGIIERGTPMAQVIPFKRDDWKSTFSYFDFDDYSAIFDRDVKSTLVNNYVKNFWSRKTFR